MIYPKPFIRFFSSRFSTNNFTFYKLLSLFIDDIRSTLDSEFFLFGTLHWKRSNGFVLLAFLISSFVSVVPWKVILGTFCFFLSFDFFLVFFSSLSFSLISSTLLSDISFKDLSLIDIDFDFLETLLFISSTLSFASSDIDSSDFSLFRFYWHRITFRENIATVFFRNFGFEHF